MEDDRLVDRVLGFDFLLSVDRVLSESVAEDLPVPWQPCLGSLP